MNNFYTLIYLTFELKKTLKNTIFEEALTSQKNRLDLYFTSHNEPIKVSVSVEPGISGIFIDRYTPPKHTNSAQFFETLQGATLNDIELADRDRLLFMSFNTGVQLVFQLFGVNANVFLVSDKIILTSFKHQNKYNGKQAPKARKPMVKNSKEVSGSVRQKLISINPLLPRQLLPDLIDYFNLEEKSSEELEAFNQDLHYQLKNNATPGVLQDGRVCILPESYFPISNKKVFNSFNECVRSSYYYRMHSDKFADKKNNLISQLDNHHKKLKNRIKNIQDAEKSLIRSEQYEKYGHLLMANLNIDIHHDTESVKVDDLFDGSKSISIPLIKGQTLSENASRYYDKSREAKKAYENAITRLEGTATELTDLEGLISSLHEIDSLRELEKWIKANQRSIQNIGVGLKNKQQARHPYRVIPEGSHIFWIGKNTKGNDELLHDSHKEDIWLHARGYAGSHVIIRMNKASDFPSREILEKAASYAAKYSKGSSSSLIPVIYTKRKYVRKPKGAAPGQVKVMREQVILTGANK